MCIIALLQSGLLLLHRIFESTFFPISEVALQRLQLIKWSNQPCFNGFKTSFSIKHRCRIRTVAHPYSPKQTTPKYDTKYIYIIYIWVICLSLLGNFSPDRQQTPPLHPELVCLQGIVYLQLLAFALSLPLERLRDGRWEIERSIGTNMLQVLTTTYLLRKEVLDARPSRRIWW